MSTTPSLSDAKCAVRDYLHAQRHETLLPLSTIGAVADAACNADLFDFLYDYVDLLPEDAATCWINHGRAARLYVRNPFAAKQAGDDSARPAVTVVHNLVTGETLIFTLPAPEAVMAAHLQAIGRRNTWEYPELFKRLRPTLGRQSICMGDFCARLPSPGPTTP